MEALGGILDEGAMMKVGDCRCTHGQRVNYMWAGIDIEKQDEESWSEAIARWFALKTANEELQSGNLDSKRFEQFKDRTYAYIKQKIDRAIEGKLIPGTEIVIVSKASHEGMPIFELVWHNPQNMLKSRKKQLIRQYEGEPPDRVSDAFGLHMHLKSVEGGDIKIHEDQDVEITKAIDVYRHCVDVGWPECG